MLDCEHMPIRVTQIGVGGFDDNFSYLVHDLDTKKGMVIDPSGSFERVVHAAAMLGIEVTDIVLTHSHGDHFDALEEAMQAYPRATVRIHENGEARVPTAVEPFADSHSFALGDGRVEVLYTPGHTDDSVCLYIAAQESCPPQLVTGDTVFVDGCGRIPREQAKTMFDSLQRVKALPAETVIYPGHDYGETPTSTLGAQMASNRFLNTNILTEFVERRLGSGAVQ